MVRKKRQKIITQKIITKTEIRKSFSLNKELDKNMYVDKGKYDANKCVILHTQ